MLTNLQKIKERLQPMITQILRLTFASVALFLLSELVGLGVAALFSTKLDIVLQYLVGIGTITTLTILFEMVDGVINKGGKLE